ncbi:MAG TPA: arylsulfatase [Cyanobacteria bacterium UBA11149]|nr:arylsulfatase [Cyanobacteria bacterium UBA11367]HBE59906.1 arylsulfatase [Cyanobacteria bacterium UBA11366]HBR75862.1 arylsulfatase [Cyanobacteria bacterium UBA11159]HBS69284.1 arylsulfatase [Cyanobacteria bacterium UBA11153]HBW90439.1 arylsulfatase [Cyanobacteria bacterium UBA11149]HCA96639.1 arylsulfatase [Cyanobacteria bacterium UBA9226]
MLQRITRLIFVASVTTVAVIFSSSVRESASGQSNRRSKDERPNIVILVADDMGYTDIGAYGSEVPTPNIDALANKGMKFTNFHVGPSCSPSRSMILTGVDNHKAGFGSMRDRITPNQKGKPGYEAHLTQQVVTFADMMKDSGYHTYMVGKWHMGEEREFWPYSRGFEQSFAMLQGAGSHYTNGGFDHLDPINTFVENDKMVSTLPKDFYSTKTFTDKTIEFIDKNRKDDKPFIAYMAYTAPHSPFQAPQEYIKKYMGKYDAGWDKIREQRFKRMKELGIIPDYINLPPRWPMVKAWDQLSPEEKKIESKKMAVYAAMIDYLDMSIGRFVKYLKDTGEYDNTIFIFMSDNGGSIHDVSHGMPEYEEWLKKSGYDNSYENIGNPNSFTSTSFGWGQVITTPHWAAKGTVASGGIKAPFFVTYPKAIKPGITRAFANVRDMTPTFLDYAGAKMPGNKYKGKSIYPIEGKSMRPLWEGKKERIYGDNDPVGFELYGKANKALILGDWKILRLGDMPWGSGNNEKWKLFNMAIDPTDMNDLSAIYPNQVQKMIALYEQYEKNVGVVPAEAPQSSLVNPNVGINPEVGNIFDNGLLLPSN